MRAEAKTGAGQKIQETASIQLLKLLALIGNSLINSFLSKKMGLCWVYSLVIWLAK